MISSTILVKTATIKEVSGFTYDTVGCPISASYGTTYSNIPCYYTEDSFTTKEGQELNRNIYRMYINTDTISALNLNYKVEVDSKNFDILNIEETFKANHLELIIKGITND